MLRDVVRDWRTIGLLQIAATTPGWMILRSLLPTCKQLRIDPTGRCAPRLTRLRIAVCRGGASPSLRIF